MPSSSATGRAARIQPGRQEGPRAAAQAQDGGHSGGLGVPLGPADVGESGAQRVRRVRRGIPSGRRRRRRRRRDLPPARRASSLRFPRQAVLQLAQARRPDAAQRRRQGLRPAVRLRLRTALRTDGRSSKAFRGAAQGRRASRRGAVRPRHCAAGVELRVRARKRRPDEGHRPPRAGGFAGSSFGPAMARQRPRSAPIRRSTCRAKRLASSASSSTIASTARRRRR